MSKIMDYILWRGDLSFDIFPLNQVDLAVLTQLPLLNLSNVFEADEKLTLKEAFQKYDELKNDSERREVLLIFKRIYNAFKLMAKSPRYMNILLSDYCEIIDHDNPCQFSAISMHLQDHVVVSYGGTDDTIVGWHEDFQLLYLDEIPSHRHGLKYLKEICKKTDKDIILCGHSKGGNIAMNTIFNAPKTIEKRISKVYCYDGPGINKTDFDDEKLKDRIDKIESYIPYRSSIGKLFDHFEKYKIVECSANLLFQHDVLTWQVNTTDFVYRGVECPDSIYLDHHVKQIVARLDLETRKKFVSAMFNVLYLSDVDTYRDVVKSKRKIFGHILKLNKEDKKIFRQIFFGGMLKDAKIRKMLMSILKEKKKID